MHFSSIDRTLSGATTLGQSGLGSIFQTSNITGTSSSDGFMSYQDTRWGEGYPSAEIQLVYSTTSADWANLLAICHPTEINLSRT